MPVEQCVPRAGGPSASSNAHEKTDLKTSQQGQPPQSGHSFQGWLLEATLLQVWPSSDLL